MCLIMAGSTQKRRKNEVPYASVCYFKYSFSHIYIVLWNKLPADLVLVPDLDSFKTGVSEINHTHP